MAPREPSSGQFGMVPAVRRALGLALLTATAGVAASAAPPAPDVRLFLEAASTDEQVARAALEQIARSWSDDHAALIVDLLRFTRPPGRPQGDDHDG